MANQNEHRVTSLEAIREQVGEPIAGVALKVSDAIDEFARTFIAESPFITLATADADGNIDVSPKGDAPGFVHVPDEKTLLIPDRSGNKLVFGHQNILANPHVGVLFMIPGTPETLRVNGRATLTRDPELLEVLAAKGKPALLAIRIDIDRCFFHCAKAFLRAKLWKPGTWPERKKISFGQMLAPKMGGGDELASAIDKMVDEDYEQYL